jgi:hypothetical protein
MTFYLVKDPEQGFLAHPQAEAIHTSSSFLKLCTSKILLEQYRKSGRRVLRSGDLNHSKSLGVLVKISETMLYLHLPIRGFRYPRSKFLKGYLSLITMTGRL